MWIFNRNYLFGNLVSLYVIYTINRNKCIIIEKSGTVCQWMWKVLNKHVCCLTPSFYIQHLPAWLTLNLAFKYLAIPSWVSMDFAVNWYTLYFRSHSVLTYLTSITQECKFHCLFRKQSKLSKSTEQSSKHFH